MGRYVFCVDYRKLNAVTRPDNYPMPRTEELLEKLGRAQFISTLDLSKGYWQVPLDESTKERSAFTTHVGLYEFNVLPFGLRNAPTTFQRLVDGLLAGLGEYAVAYLDDVAIFSDSWAEHLEHLQKVVVPQYSQIAASLTDLTKKKQPNAVWWTEERQKAFNQLKVTLMSDPVLRAPDFDKLFLVTTDASERGVGAV
ncbi:unnamed protein product [Lepidochelys kempii]